jgi:hypothetical protein
LLSVLFISISRHTEKHRIFQRSNLTILQREKMDADHQDDNGDHHKRRHGRSQQPNPPPPQDQVRREALLKKRRNEKRDDLEAMVNIIMRDPKKLNNRIFDPIRTLVTDAVLHPTKYDLTMQAAANPMRQQPSDRPNLSGAIAQKLRRRQEIDVTISPRVQVTAKSLDYSNRTQPHVHVLKRFTLHVIDENYENINVKVNSGLNSFMDGVEVGTVLTLVQFQPMYFNYEDGSDDRVLILLNRFINHGFFEVPNGKLQQPDPSYNITIRDEANSDNNVESRIGSGSAGSANNSNQNEENPSGNIQPPTIPECRGRLCSQCGITFLRCITQCHPLENVDLEAAAMENPFADRPVDGMDNPDKRFVLYYWYATNIYSIFGKQNRVKLPPCLIWAIRNLHPSDNYMGHHEADFER